MLPDLPGTKGETVQHSLHDGRVRQAVRLSEPLRGAKHLRLHEPDALQALLQLLSDDEPARDTASA